MKIETGFVLRVAGTLTAISVVVAGLLGGVDKLTAPNIEAINRANTERSLRAVVLSENSEFPELEITDAMVAAASDKGGKLIEAYEVTVSGDMVGYAFKIVAGGSQGDIEMIVGVGDDGNVTGVSVVDQAETSGIGSKVIENWPVGSGVGVLDQFIGRGGDGTLAVGGEIEAISGATVTTKGITKGVNAALSVTQELS